ncbi:hypothetical protein [Streptomyces sp. NPDC046197]|uniref:hypothetical protein n=1 Tax=Streptomyces sp. NPDC046197 TaxID=3154337 RepID=UPI0033E5AA70
MIRVLVVDGEALIRTGFTHILSRHILSTADVLEGVAAVPGGQAVRTVRERAGGASSPTRAASKAASSRQDEDVR